MLDDDHDDHAVATRLAAIRWPAGPVCTRCGGGRFCHLRSRPRVFECLNCHRQLSVTAGTLLHGTRLPLRTWILAARLELRPDGVSTAELARMAGLSRDTAWHLKQRLQAGLRDPTEDLLHTFVETSRGATGSARSPRDPRHHTLPFAAFRDAGGGIYLCPLPVTGAVRRTCDDLSKKWDRDRTRAAIRGANHRINRVHHGVSELWFRAYLDAWATTARWRHEHSDPVPQVLAALLGGPRMTFERLRPERPDHWLNARWNWADRPGRATGHRRTTRPAPCGP